MYLCCCIFCRPLLSCYSDLGMVVESKCTGFYFGGDLGLYLVCEMRIVFICHVLRVFIEYVFVGGF